MNTSKKHKSNKIKRSKNIKGAVPKKHKVIYKDSFIASRYLMAIIVIVVLLSALIVRAIYVQFLDSEKLNQRADKLSVRTVKVLPSRGDILDRNGKLFASSVPMRSVAADPKVILEGEQNNKNKNGKEKEKVNSLETEPEKWMALADVLNLPYDSLVQLIKKKPNSRFVYLSKQTPVEIAEYIRKLHLPGIVLRKASKRFYPESEKTAHLLGHTNIDGEGISGVEKSFNNFLQGKAGSRSYRRDRKGKVIEDIQDIKKYDAQDLYLSIDKRLQSIAYEEIKKAVELNKADSGTAVLVDIQTGEILAMVNAPSYNPNNKNEIDPNAPFTRNRAITDIFEPGSTVKPFVVLTALWKGYANTEEKIDTHPLSFRNKNGRVFKTVTDVARRSEQNLKDILRNSSNVGVSKLSLRMPPEVLIKTYQDIGFGQPTEVGLIGEQSGALPSHNHWGDFDRAVMAYGYSLTVTPLQLARAYITLGSFGIYRPLSITKVDPPIIGKRIFPEKVTRDIVNIMELVAIKNKNAMVDGYRVGVKTGTAKKVGKSGQYGERYLSYTAGIAPISNPRYALVVLLDEPDPKIGYYGGKVAAPIFSKIMGRVLRINNITPDRLNLEEKKEPNVYIYKTQDDK